MSLRARFARVTKKLEVKRSDEDADFGNKDHKPLTPEEANWKIIDFFPVYCFFGLHIGAWTTGSSLLSLGLTVWQAVLSLVIAGILFSIGIIYSGLEGVDWRISAPSVGAPSVLAYFRANIRQSRKVWGLRGYVFLLGMQTAGSTLWHGVQGWYGAKCLEIVIATIIPAFLRIPDTLSGPISPSELISCLLFWGISVPFFLVSPDRWKIPGRIALSMCAVNLMVVTFVCIGVAGGGGPLLKEPARFVEVKDVAKNAGVAWQVLHGVTLFGGTVTLLYTSTFSRFAARPGYQIPGTIAMIWVNIVVMVFGIVSTSAAITIFPNESRLLWAPYELLGAWLKVGGAGARAGAFFSGLCFVLAQIIMNVTANGYVNGQNLSSIFPRYLNTRRGTLLVAAIALAVNPWRLADRASSFTKFLVVDNLLTVPGSGLLLADYFIVRRRKIRVSHLYIRNEDSIYWYTRGFNFRAFIAWTVTIVWLVPGVIRSVTDGSVGVPKGWDYPYYVAVFISIFGGGLVYILICKIWPPAGLGQTDDSAAASEETVNPHAPNRQESSDIDTAGTKTPQLLEKTDSVV